MIKKLGKYELVQEVGRGAMGEVYKAHDPLIGRLVAIKTINASLVGDPNLLERFYQEARSAGTLQHPNIVTIYELGKENETPFIAMEFLEGESLDRMIGRASSLRISQKVGYLVSVCRALDYAHKRGVIHRDVKPGNVMVARDGRVKVVDFGIARLADHNHTQTNVLMGTLQYISPQQIRGERADERSDIWALGVMFYELLCGRRPFDGDNHATLMMNIVDEQRQPPAIAELVPECPRALESLIGHMLNKVASQRIQSMEEVLFELEPLWRNLQEEDLSELIASGEKFIQSNDFFRARDVLRSALHVNGANERAKALLETVNKELKKSQMHPQVLDILDRGRNFLEEGRIQDAVAAGEAALRIDSNFLPAKEFIADVQNAAERTRRTQHNADQVKDHADDFPAPGDLTQVTEGVTRAPVLEPRPIPTDWRPKEATASQRVWNIQSLKQQIIQHRVPLSVGSLLVIVGIPALLISTWRSPSQKQIALRDHARQLEQQKIWPQALSEYQTLAHGWGALASEGKYSATSLQKLLDQEMSLWRQAQDLEAAGNPSGAAAIYRQIADLHGDKEADAQTAVARLVSGTKPGAKRPGTLTDASLAEGKTPSGKSGEGCQLLSADWPRFLDMADRNRANGMYADAQREYNSVLECDPANARARTGLRKIGEAKAVPKSQTAN